MLTEQKQGLAAAFRCAAQGLIEARASGQPVALPEISLDRPKQASHGDLACSVALQLAKPLRMSPRQAAEEIVARVRDHDAARHRLIESMEIAGPGFINIVLRASAKLAVVGAALEQRAAFGRNRRGKGAAVMVEFVSANPTGPLHVGHGRQGALGDTLCALLDANGWTVTREFYYNDAGAQINNLALSVQARCRGIEPTDERFPADGYRGDYIRDIASDYLAGATVDAERVAAVTGAKDPDDLDAIRRFAVAYLRHEQDMDLQAFGVRFDNYYLESSLYTEGKVADTVSRLIAAGRTFEDGGALWLRTTDYGDDKDRVMRKSDGGYTYFVPDVAYHVTKWQRGFAKAINVQGSDHHGTIARVRAGLQAIGVGIPQGYPDYVLHKMVTVMKGGEEVKISKRAGMYVTLRDLVEWSSGDDHGGDLTRGRDAVRYFLISRKADTEFVFDVDLALARTDENPVYYVQYAHARINSVLAQWATRDPAAAAASGLAADGRIVDEVALSRRMAMVDLAPLTLPREFSLAARLSGFPELVESACDELAPHSIAFYLKDLAAELHSYYNAERFLVDEEPIRLARLALLVATRQVLRNGLTLLGVSAPERM